MRRLLSATVAAVAVASILLTACGSAADDAAQPGGRAPGSVPAAPAGEITVFAAASLTEAFEALGTAFEQSHPNASIIFNFGPSSGLAVQITAGAPADVFAPASPASMDVVVAADAARAPTVFAANFMAIAVLVLRYLNYLYLLYLHN